MIGRSKPVFVIPTNNRGKSKEKFNIGIMHFLLLLQIMKCVLKNENKILLSKILNVKHAISIRKNSNLYRH